MPDNIQIKVNGTARTLSVEPDTPQRVKAALA